MTHANLEISWTPPTFVRLKWLFYLGIYTYHHKSSNPLSPYLDDPFEKLINDNSDWQASNEYKTIRRFKALI